MINGFLQAHQITPVQYRDKEFLLVLAGIRTGAGNKVMIVFLLVLYYRE
jgi:hypothetical protein